MPLWLGGSSDAAIRRTARFGTGWQGAFETPDETARVIAAIRSAAADARAAHSRRPLRRGFRLPLRRLERRAGGAQRQSLSRTLGRDPASAIVCGGTAEIMERIHAYVGAGVSKFILRPIGDGDDDMLDQTRRLIGEALPEVAGLNRAAA